MPRLTNVDLYHETNENHITSDNYYILNCKVFPSTSVNITSLELTVFTNLVKLYNVEDALIDN